MSRVKTKEFLALMHGGIFIDPNMLRKGLYEKDVPVLYREDTSINHLVQLAENLELQGLKIGNYIDNVRKCQLVPVSLTIEPV